MMTDSFQTAEPSTAIARLPEDGFGCTVGKSGKAAQHLAAPSLFKLARLALLFLNLPFPQKCELSGAEGIFCSLLSVG